MKAGVISAAGHSPIYTDFREPTAAPGMERITVSASALSHLSKARSSGRHYSSEDAFPAVAGVDGVGRTADGRRVYFVLPEAPFGALAEFSLAPANHCIPLPDSLDDITAAAIANPGMSAWAALAERARLVPGETVLINGATGAAGRVAVQLAKHFGAARVIATGRNQTSLEELKSLGADVLLPFALDTPTGAKHFEQALASTFADGIHVVIDYLWGTSARTIIAAIAKSVDDPAPIRFVQVGTAGGEDSLDLPGAALRSSSIILMGSGLKSVPFPTLLASIGRTFQAVRPANLQISTTAVPLSAIESTWATAPGNPRVVFTIP